MTLYQKFRKLKIDHSAIGLELAATEVKYFCTPKGARIIGSAGVDGIHYCTISGFGEMIFAVSPMNFGDYVHPIARNFEDLLRMLLFCADMAGLEQCYAWDADQFKAFMIDCPATEEQQVILDTIRKKFGLEPMVDAFAYVKALQAEFLLSKIRYTEDYYDIDMNPTAPATPAEWKVTYDGGFWSNEGNAGFEVTIGKSFLWGSEKWYIPAVYICDKGLVIDYFMEADPTQVKAFIDKWGLYNEDRKHYTKEEMEQIQREHPLNVNLRGRVIFNGELMQNSQGWGLTWIPDSCLPEKSCYNPEAKFVLEHYDMDLNQTWSINRCSYRWGESNGLDMRMLSVRMERQRENIPGQHFTTPAVGESILLNHPLTEQTYTLTVHEVEQEKLPRDTFRDSLRDSSMEYPGHFIVMSYSLEPDIPGSAFMLQDCAEGDKPRQKKRDPNAAHITAAAIGIIGGAHGPTSIYLRQNTPELHVACSALHFDPVDEVEWRSIFSEKTIPDVDVVLI